MEYTQMHKPIIITYTFQIDTIYRPCVKSERFWYQILLLLSAQ